MPHHDRSDADRPDDGGAIEITSEFARVRVSLDTTGRGPRLEVRDRETDHVVHLDALELAGICRSDDAQRRDWLLGGIHRG